MEKIKIKFAQNLEKYLPGKPKRIDELHWVYYQPQGINLVSEIRVKGKYITTEQTIVSWKEIEKALEVYKKAKVKRGF